MNSNDPVQQPDPRESRRGDRKSNISPDGKWKSFSGVRYLLQYLPSGVYYGRLQIGPKIARQSLETETYSTAKLRLGDYLKKHRKRAAKPMLGTVGEARKAYETVIDADHTLKDGSKIYRRNCVKALVRTWPGLEETPPGKITETECREWAGKFAAQYDDQFFNNTLGTLREILKRAGLGRDDNPAFQVKRLGVKPKELKLPEAKQFEELLKELENGGARQSKDCADLVRFLAYSGCRISEAGQVKWADVDLTRNEIRVETAKRAKTSGASSVRFIPIIPPMRELLTRLKEAKTSAEDSVCNVSECEKSLTRACKVLKLHRMTHHDLRHLFATRCIESGVDIPTVSRWLGHSDGGALAMRTYGHLRREHSATMAQKVTFQAAQFSPTLRDDRETCHSWHMKRVVRNFCRTGSIAWLALAVSVFAVACVFVGCSHSPRSSAVAAQAQDPENLAGRYIGKREVPSHGDEVGLVMVGYEDLVSMDVNRETLDKAGIDYALFSNLGIAFLVKPSDLVRAKQLLRNEVRLKGRRISIAP